MSSICFPPFLNPGDGIAIISSARKIDIGIIEQAKKRIEEQGFKVHLGQTIGLEHHQFAGTDEERASDLNWAIHNPNVKAIFFARGGYGTVRLLDKIDWNHFQKHPKWLVGYSDITVFHSKCQQLNIASIHATMPVNYESNTSASLKELFDLLKGKPNSLEVAYTGPEIAGPLVGGNLSILYSLSGTDCQLNTEGKLLFIEDLDEYLYHVDRMFQNLKYSRQLSKKTKTLLLGGLTDMNDNEIPFGFSAEESAHQMAGELGIPMARNIPAGHQNENRPLCLGAIYTLSNNILSLTDPTFPT